MNKDLSPLHKTSLTGKTDVWNDSCSPEELAYSLANGSVGATTNPSIVLNVLKKEMHLWKDRINEMLREMPYSPEDDIAWKLIEEMAVKGSESLREIFIREKGKKGRLSIQTSARNYRSSQLLLDQALRFNTLAPNLQVKIPATAAGIKAIEEATRRGVSINATVSFTVSQAVAVAEAVERGLALRVKDGGDISSMSPVCTIMVGRVDDWIKIVANKENIIADPVCYEWAGVAVMKKAYGIYMEKGYRTRLLVAAYRNHLHWSEFIGGDIILSIPYLWQKRYNGSDVKVMPRIDNPVDFAIINELTRKFPEFIKAYEENGLQIDEFESYGATIRTLREFNGAYDEVAGIIRNMLLPNQG